MDGRCYGSGFAGLDYGSNVSSAPARDLQPERINREGWTVRWHRSEGWKITDPDGRTSRHSDPAITIREALAAHRIVCGGTT